jgi:hypothetical protein
MHLRSDETLLVGTWLVRNGRVHPDATTERIGRLTAASLELVARTPDGDRALYRDPRDRRLWEHTPPGGSPHDGSPPSLMVIAESHARAKYRLPEP